MIQVTFDLRQATPDELAELYSLPRVAGAIDVLSQLRLPGIELHVQTPAPDALEEDRPDAVQ